MYVLYIGCYRLAGAGKGRQRGGGEDVFFIFYFFLTDQSFGGISGFEYQYRMYPYFILS